MNSNGLYNTAHGIEKHGFRATGTVYYNLTEAQLYEEALARREAQLSAHGALVAKTGIHTGRSAKDKHVVRDGKVDEKIWWDNNRPMEPEAFDRLYEDFMTQAQGMDLFVSDLAGGADEAHKLPVRVITENAWHALFIRNLLIRPERDELASFVPEMSIIDLPSFEADPERHGCRSGTVIAVDLTRMIVLIGGTAYAGEMIGGAPEVLPDPDGPTVDDGRHIRR